MSAYTDHLADPLRESTWLVEIATTLRSDGSAVTLRYSSGPFQTKSTDTPASTTYSARLTSPLNFGLEAADADASGGEAARGGAIRLGQIAGDLTTLPDTYALTGSTATIKLGGYTPSTGVTMGYSDYGTVGIVEIASVEPTELELVLAVRDLSARLDDRVERRYYGGRDWCGRFDNGASYFSYVDYGSDAKLNVTGDATWMAWVYLTTLGVGGQQVVGWRGGSARAGALWIADTGEVSYLDSVNGAATSLTLSTHVWYHVAVVRDDAGTVTFYVYNVATGALTTEIVSGLTFPAPSAAGGATWRVGANVRGLVSDVMFFSGALGNLQVDRYRTGSIQAESEHWPILEFYATLNETTADSSDSPATASTTGTANYVPTCDGDDALAGTPVPVCYGKVRNITPTLVDARRLIFQFTDIGGDVSAIQSREGGYPHTTGSARTNLIDLITTTPTAGAYDWHLSGNGGFIRLGSNPSKPVTVDVTLTNTAADDVLTDLLTERGTDPFVGGDLDIVMTDTPVVGWYSGGQQATIRDAVEYLLAGLGSYWVARDGDLVVRSLYDPDTGTPVVTLTERDVVEWEEIERRDPVWQYGLLCRRNWTPLAGDALNATLIGTVDEPFYRNQWNYARVRDRDVLTTWPRARLVDVETAIDTRPLALPIAQSRLDLLAVPDRTLRVVARGTGIVIDRFDTVTLDVSMPDLDLAEVSRLSGDWLALGVEEDARDATVTLTLWRPE